MGIYTVHIFICICVQVARERADAGYVLRRWCLAGQDDDGGAARKRKVRESGDRRAHDPAVNSTVCTKQHTIAVHPCTKRLPSCKGSRAPARRSGPAGTEAQASWAHPSILS